MSGFWELKVRGDFAAAHALRNYHGKCERTHGHNFGVEICVRGAKLDPDTEILLDFKVLKSALKTVLADLDHRFLNELDFFTSKNPSSENLARHIFERLQEMLSQMAGPRACEAQLQYVAVSENSNQSAAYFGGPPLSGAAREFSGRD